MERVYGDEDWKVNKEGFIKRTEEAIKTLKKTDKENSGKQIYFKEKDIIKAR